MSVYLIENYSLIGGNNQNRRIELKKEMLEWPVWYYGEEKKTEEKDNAVLKGKERYLIPAYKVALSALMDFKDFDIEISLKADIDNKYLVYAKRTWSCFYLNNRKVIIFTHYSKMKNPYYDLRQWPEKKDYKDTDDWTIKQWRKFFIEEIRERAEKRLQKAKIDKQTADKKLTKESNLYGSIMRSVEETLS